MSTTIERPADCVIRTVIRILNARNVKPADTHRQICEVYGEIAMRSRGAAGRLWSKAATLYEERIQKLVSRYYKCLNNRKNYVEN